MRELTPEPSETTNANERAETGVQGDDRYSWGTQRMRRPPTRLAYGNLGNPTDCWGNINMVNAGGPSMMNSVPPISRAPPILPPATVFSTSPTPLFIPIHPWYYWWNWQARPLYHVYFVKDENCYYRNANICHQKLFYIKHR